MVCETEDFAEEVGDSELKKWTTSNQVVKKTCTGNQPVRIRPRLLSFRLRHRSERGDVIERFRGNLVDDVGVELNGGSGWRHAFT